MSVRPDEAYREANSNIRHYSHLRFVILPAYLVLNGAVLSFGLEWAPAGEGWMPLSYWIMILTLAASLIFAAVSIEGRVHKYLEHFKTVAKDLEGEKGVRLWAPLLEAQRRTHALVTWVYVAVGTASLALLGLRLLGAARPSG